MAGPSDVFKVETQGKHTVRVIDETGLVYFTLNPKAYADQEDAVALAQHLAKFMTQMRMWS